MNLKRIHYLQHVPYEDLGCIQYWAEENGFTLTATKFFESSQLPAIDDFDWLIVMGGPMGANEEDRYHWIREEKSFIKQAVQAGKTVVGICLGSQLVAAALGARVYPNRHKEIGWFDISLTNEGKLNPLLRDFPTTFKIFHWHGDTFDLPNGSQHFFQSAGCRNQAFLYKEKVLGLQFHFEITSESLHAMVENGRHELIPDQFIQTEKEILEMEAEIEVNNQKLFTLLDRLEKISTISEANPV